MADDLSNAAAAFIAKWEGFSARAYWDINHWRLGYGSSTEGPSEIPVTKDMTTTSERAQQNLALRVGAFRAICIAAATPRLWQFMSRNQQIALIDLCYNYGHIPIDLTGSSETVAGRIARRGTDNGGINAKRRQAESSLYLTKDISIMTTGTPNPQAQVQMSSAATTVHKVLSDVGAVLKSLTNIAPEIELALGLISPQGAAVLKSVMAAAPAIEHIASELESMIEKL
jgi:GH24 family phage-related lysozyme (muramidase)